MAESTRKDRTMSTTEIEVMGPVDYLVVGAASEPGSVAGVLV